VAQIVVPPGLAPGDHYHLVFLTAGARDADSTDIADYDAFVQQEATAAGAITEHYGITWRAIASTPTTNAIDHINQSGPVFLLDGTKISDQLFGIEGGITSPIDFSQFGLGGHATDFHVWTGTYLDGGGRSGNELGSTHPWFGLSNASGLEWVDSLDSLIFGGEDDRFRPLPLYAISELLTVPHTDPVELILDLLAEVDEINLAHGIQNALDAKLDNALDALEAENANFRQTAINKLQAFISSVEAQRGNMISDADADHLFASAMEIIDILNE
jgi:hypothetical protein